MIPTFLACDFRIQEKRQPFPQSIPQQARWHGIKKYRMTRGRGDGLQVLIHVVDRQQLWFEHCFLCTSTVSGHEPKIAGLFEIGFDLSRRSTHRATNGFDQDGFTNA